MHPRRIHSVAHSPTDFRPRSNRRRSRRIDRGFRRLVAVVVEPRAIGEEGDVLGEIEGDGDDDHGEEEEDERVEDELLGRSQHVQTECDFVLVSLPLEPAECGGENRHRKLEELRGLI